MFLTQQELRDLTDYKRPSDQIRWLRRNGYLFHISGNKRPVVVRSHADERRATTGNKRQRKDNDGLLCREYLLRRAIPIKSFPGVYFLISGGMISYVGKSTNVLNRVAQHLSEKTKAFDAISYVLVPKKRLSEVEAMYIKKFNPWNNKTHKNND